MPDLAEVGSQTPVDEVRRTWTSYCRLAEMTDVEDPDGVADCRVFREHPST
jgi:hypothetical protein